MLLKSGGTSQTKLPVNFEHFEKYRPAVRSYQGDPQSPSLRMFRDGEFEVFYSPFEWVNPTAKIVFVGITPGKTQASVASVFVSSDVPTFTARSSNSVAA